MLKSSFQPTSVASVPRKATNARPSPVSAVKAANCISSPALNFSSNRFSAMPAKRRLCATARRKRRFSPPAASDARSAASPSVGGAGFFSGIDASHARISPSAGWNGASSIESPPRQ